MNICKDPFCILFIDDEDFEVKDVMTNGTERAWFMEKRSFPSLYCVATKDYKVCFFKLLDAFAYCDKHGFEFVERN